MSFGFGIGDLIGVADLCWRLYSRAYKVSRDAPEELRGLNQELGNFHNTIQLLLEELKDTDSIVFNSGDVRIDTVRRVVSQSEETLKKMQQLSERYAELQSSSTVQEKRRMLRIYWDRLKYTRELHNINDLRSKIMLHNSQLTLILQGAQNSSLERIEKQNAQTDKKLDELRELIVSNPAQRDLPMLTAPLHPDILMELTDVFLQKAESGNRPWASIGIDNWLQAGQWWLMKAQSQLATAPQVDEEKAIYNQGYANILKACWILTDVIAIHPQRSHMGASNDRRAHHIQRLTQGAIYKLKTLSTVMPRLEDLLTCSLDIWNLPISTALTPSRQYTGDQPELRWQTQDGQIIFQGFAEYQDDRLKPPIECIVVLELPNEQSANQLVNLIAQSSIGQDVFKLQLGESDHRIPSMDIPIKPFTKRDKRLLNCIFESLSVIRQSLIQRPVDASTIYSVAILLTCIGAKDAFFDHTANFDTAYEDINTLLRYKQQLQITSATNISSSFQSMADRIVECFKQCSDCFQNKSDRIFWKLNHHCIWMLIYWFSDTSEAFLELFKAAGIHSSDFHPISEGCLMLSSLLKKDSELPQKFLSLVGFELGWTPRNLDCLIVATDEDDLVLLQTAIENIEKKVVIQGWNKVWAHAQYHAKFHAMDILLSAPGVSLNFLFLSILKLASYHKWQELQILWSFLRSRIQHVSDTDKCLLNFGKTSVLILQNYGAAIYKGSLQDLEIFLDIIKQFRISLDYYKWPLEIQLAILPALASRKLSVLRHLSEASVVSFSEAIFTADLDIEFPGYGASFLNTSSAFIWPLSLAILLVLDLDVIEYIGDNGACLRNSWEISVGEPDILTKIRQTTTLSEARKQSCFVKGDCYRLFLAINLHSDIDSENGDMSSHRSLGSFLTIWKTMCRILFENDCRDMYDINGVYSELTWIGIQKQLYPDDSEHISIQKAVSWPAPLLTQESWDTWRLHAIDIIEKTHRNDLKNSNHGLEDFFRRYSRGSF